MTDEPGAWGTCAYCGDAVPATASKCPICGAGNPVRAGTLAAQPTSTRRRVRFLQALRATIVVAIIVGVGYAIISAELTGPGTISDPLTTAATHPILAGSYAMVSGPITGEDYIIGNYSVVTPPGALVQLTVYNSTEYFLFVNGTSTGNQWVIQPETSSQIIFAAPYTDTFFFVFSTPYPAATNLTVNVYIVTNYESNVVIG